MNVIECDEVVVFLARRFLGFLLSLASARLARRDVCITNHESRTEAPHAIINATCTKANLIEEYITRLPHTMAQNDNQELSKDLLQAAEAAIKAVDDERSSKSIVEWAQRNNLYLPQVTLEECILSSENNDEIGLLVVDVRDDDHIGGRVRGAIHRSDTSLSQATNLASLASNVLALGSNGTVVFHCMESLRRGPRCAKRLTLLFEFLKVKDDAPTVKVLHGGADQWIRKFWNRSELVDDYDDEIWWYEEDQKRQHRLYVHPNDGLTNREE